MYKIYVFYRRWWPSQHKGGKSKIQVIWAAVKIKYTDIGKFIGYNAWE